jgi:hypothetical protein
VGQPSKFQSQSPSPSLTENYPRHSRIENTAHSIATFTMVLPKSKKSVGLGNSLMNDRFGKGKGSDMRRGNFTGGIERTGQNGERVSYAHAHIERGR